MLGWMIRCDRRGHLRVYIPRSGGHGAHGLGTTKIMAAIARIQTSLPGLCDPPNSLPAVSCIFVGA